MDRDLTYEEIKNVERKDRVFHLARLLQALYHSNAYDHLDELEEAVQFLKQLGGYGRTTSFLRQRCAGASWNLARRTSPIPRISGSF